MIADTEAVLQADAPCRVRPELNAVGPQLEHSGWRALSIPRCVAWLDAHEISWVRRQMAFAEQARLASAAGVINTLGSGWIYACLAAGLLILEGRSALSELGMGALAVFVAHCVYPVLKRVVARQRPFHIYADMRVQRAPLDYYSFPSGHAMTICAALLPMMRTHPTLGIVLAIFALCLCWSRIVVGHHYPTDVVAGAVLGGGTCALILAMLV